MKKIALISAAAAASLAFAPAAFAAPTTQSLTIKLGSTKAGTKAAPTATTMSFDTGTTSKDPSGAKQTLSSVKITLPKGIALNYKNFAACDASTVPDTALTCPAASKIGTGSINADVYQTQDNIPGTAIPYIGTNNRLIIRTLFTAPAVIDDAIIGNVSTSGGAYTFSFTVPPGLQLPIPPIGNQQINSFKVNFAKLYAKVGKKKVPLIGLTSCPKGGYVFKGAFTFVDPANPPATATQTIKCTTAKKK